MRHNEITGIVLETSFDIPRRLDPGLLESVFENELEYELRKRRCKVEEEKPIPVVWEEV